MRTVTDIQTFRDETTPLCMAMGFFDGFHRGHLRVLESAKRRAHELGGTAWVFTFDPHPSCILRPDEAPALLMSNAQRNEYAGFLGMDGCVSMPFNLALAAQSPRDFVAHLTMAMPSLRHIAAGAQWRFGHQRTGHVPLLTELGLGSGFTVEGVDAVSYEGAPISSSRIRDCVRRGQLAAAESMLGRPFGLRGRVVTGQKLGRELGYPTANLDVATGVFPPFGIYAARAVVKGRICDGVVSYGRRPTVAEVDAPAVLELHIFEFSESLYGEEVDVYFYARIRDEMTFTGLAALAERIRLDCEEARAALRSKNGKDCLYIPHSSVHSSR